MNSVLIADDDIDLCSLLTDYLNMEEFQVQTVHHGEAAIEKVMAQHYDIIILDINMPRLSGLDVLRELQQNKVTTPVLMLTARKEDIDRILGLEMGADDYLTKPCHPRELVARLRAILRRTQMHPIESEESSVVKFGDLTLNRGSRTVFIDQKNIALTSTEFSVLEVLLKYSGQIVDKPKLSLESLSRSPSPYDRSLDMHLSRIRKKLGVHKDGSQRIKTIRSTGYIYVVSS